MESRCVFSCDAVHRKAIVDEVDAVDKLMACPSLVGHIDKPPFPSVQTSHDVGLPRRDENRRRKGITGKGFFFRSSRRQVEQEKM